MMQRKTLEGYRRVVNKFDHRPTVERERQLIDSHLEALTEIARLEIELYRQKALSEIEYNRLSEDYASNPVRKDEIIEEGGT